MRIGTSIGVTGLVLMIIACAQLPMRAATEYYIGFVNKTGKDLDGVCVYFGDREAAAKGGLMKGGTATEGVITLPVPAEADVRWIENGQPHSVKVKFKDAIPRRLTFDWTLYFVFNQDGTVQVKAIKDTDKAAYAELIKTVRPEGEYRLGFVNKTGRDLKDVSAYYGKQKVGSVREIPVRVKLGYSDPLVPPILPEAEVRWKEDSVPHAVKVKIDGVPKGFEGRIFFVIKTDGTVEVHPVKNGDDKAAFKVVR